MERKDENVFDIQQLVYQSTFSYKSKTKNKNFIKF